MTAVPGMLLLACCLVFFLVWGGISATAQTTSTWTGGAGNWSDCPPGGNALWNTCPDPPKGLGFPNGNFNAVIDGGPVNATSASIVNLTINSGGSLVFPSGVPSILDITGTSIVNDGSITLAGTDGLQLEGNTTVTLAGSGSVTMAGNNFTGANGTPTLILQQPLQGQGSFSLGMNLNNQSTINATGGTLNMQPVSAINTGTIEASSGSTLAFTNGVETAYNNTGGVIQALSGGTVQLENGIYTGGTLTTAGTGVIQLSGDAILNNLTNSGTVQVSSNTALLQGTVTNKGSLELQSAATLFMSGNVTLAGSGSLLLSGNSNLDANFTSVGLPGGQLTNQQLIHGSGTIDKLPLTNQGTIAADSSGNTLFLTGATVTNTSTMEASGGGILQIDGDETVANTGGTIEALTGSTVNIVGTIQGGTLATSGTGVIESQNATLDGTVNIPTNAGQLDAKSFDLFIQGTVANNGTIALSGNACVILNKPATLTGTGKLMMVSTTCIFGSGNAFTNQSTIQGAGTIGDSNPMPISNSGTILANQLGKTLFIVPDATGFTNTGRLIVNKGSTLEINGLFNNLSNTGTLTSGTYSVAGTFGTRGAVVTNDASITLIGASAEIEDTLTNGNALAGLTANGTLGALSLLSGQALTTATSLSNAGRITVGSGSTLKLGGSYTQTAGSTTLDGSITTTAVTLEKGSLLGKGTLGGAVTSSASITAGDSTTKPGTMTLTGTYVQNSAGILNISVGGTGAGTFGELAVSNGVSLNGTLKIKVVNGYVPKVGDTVTILTGSAVTGKFATVTGTSVNGGADHFELIYNPTNVMLKVVSGA